MIHEKQLGLSRPWIKMQLLHDAGLRLGKVMKALPIEAPPHESEVGQTRRILCAAAHALFRDPLLEHATKPDGPITWGELCRLSGRSDEHLQLFADGIRRAVWLRSVDSLQPINRVTDHVDGNGVMLEVFFRVHAPNIPTRDEAPTQWMPRLFRPEALGGRLLGHEPAGDESIDPNYHEFAWSPPPCK